jgi:hypothetical protein
MLREFAARSTAVGMFGHLEGQYAPSSLLEYDADQHNPEGRGRDGETIDGCRLTAIDSSREFAKSAKWFPESAWRSSGLLGEEVLDLVRTESQKEDGDERGNKVEFGELVERPGIQGEEGRDEGD